MDQIPAVLVALKEEVSSFKVLVAERHERYKERHDALKELFNNIAKAMNDHTASALASRDTAIGKAEEAQRAYNTSHNDLVRKMDDQNKATMPRVEIENRFKSMEEKLALLTGSFAAGTGAAQGAQVMRQESRANIGVIVAIIGSAFLIGGGLVSVVMFLVKGSP